MVGLNNRFVAGWVTAEEVLVDGLDLIKQEVWALFTKGPLYIHTNYTFGCEVIETEPFVCLRVICRSCIFV